MTSQELFLAITNCSHKGCGCPQLVVATIEEAERDSERRGAAGAYNQGYDNGFAAAREKAKGIAASLHPIGGAHTYGSENADVYINNELTCKEIAERIAAMEPEEGKCDV